MLSTFVKVRRTSLL